MNEEIKIEQKESIKLCKMSKGYNWEIKLLPGNDVAIMISDIDRLEELDKKLREKFLKGAEDD